MELYIKTPGDPNFTPNAVEINSKLEQLITQIQVVLFTNKGDFISNPDFGCSLEDLLFRFILNEDQIKERINNQIFRYCGLTQEFNVDTEVTFKQGVTRHIAYINIYINQINYLQAVIN